MLTIEQDLENLKSYIQKLKKIVMLECSFSFGNTKIVSKSRVDDIVCCIQASYPRDFKDYVKRKGAKSLESYLCFHKMLAVATNKWFLSGSYYSVNIGELERLTQLFDSVSKREIKNVENDNNFQL